GTEDYNQSLGNRRAQSVLLYFEAKGLVAKKIMLESGGEKEPVDELCTTGVSLPGFESALSSNHEQVQLPRICRSYFK
ncbi:MAG: hypothetical protein Q7J06_00165, partial [Bacteroidales bacterium]|nr:hypothetical protein [Bacteroidales bacterium]